MVQGPTVWIDLDNTPHVPFFRPIIAALQAKNCSVIVTARNAYNVVSLLELYKLECSTIGRHFGKSKLMKVVGLVVRSGQLLSFIRKYKPQLAVSHGSRAQVLASKMLGIPSVVIADYEHVTHVTRPDWLIVPDVIPESATREISNRVLRYPGIKEDVYASTLRADASILKKLGVAADELLVTMRLPAKEAHYHNPRSDEVSDAALDVLLADPRVRVVILPRNTQQENEIKARHAAALASRKIIVPDEPLDGLNLIWNSDLVVSGGGTMNREAAALGVPVYSTFCGSIGAVDLYLASRARLVLLQNPQEAKQKIRLEKRLPASSRIMESPALGTIVEQILMIERADRSASLPASDAARSGNAV